MDFTRVNLKKRIEIFVINGIKLSNKIQKNTSNLRIVPQFVDSLTSIGANYYEACEAESARDFVHKMKISLKELKETNYWLRILYRTNASITNEITVLGKESVELVKIFSSIVLKFKNEKN